MGSGVRLVRCTLAEVAAHALVPDGLIAVVDDDHVATEALGAVVDEVLRQGDLTEEQLARTAKMAAARALIRSREAEHGPLVDEASAMETLLEWITIEFVACMSGGVLEGELLEGNVKRLLARQTVTGDNALDADDTLEMLNTVHESFRRMQEVLQAVRVLSGSDASGSILVAPLCQALSRVLHSRAVPVADVVLEVDATCETSARPGKLVAALVLLVGDVLDRAARGGSAFPKQVKLTLRARSIDGAAVVELEDDLDTDADDDARIRASPLPHVRRILRDEGAEVQVTSASGRHLVRLLLPRAKRSGTVSPDALLPIGDSRAN